MATGAPAESRRCIAFFASLDDYATARGVGEAYTDSMGFTVPELPSGRESFSPDASYYSGVFPLNEMKFIAGPPTFAVEVRSENAYKRSAEIDIDAKRADYFAAGTLVVWEVDPIADTITCYRAAAQTVPVLFQRGQTADAEPAVPGWRMPVDEIFA